LNVLFAAPENAWGGFLRLIIPDLPGHHFEATGRFGVDTLKGYDVLIPTMCTVTRQMLMESDRLKLIQQCGAGLESVDLEAARDLGIRVANVPTDISGNADSVAELGIYFMIGLSRDVGGMARSMANRRMGEPQGKALKGRVVGLVGLGGIGRALIRRLRSFDVRLVGVKRHHPERAKRDLGLEWAGGPGDLEELLSRSDFVILCLPLTAESQHLMNTATLAAMKPDAYLVNLSRGGLVDRDALEEALATGRIAGAGLDVYWEEPPDPHDPIFRHNVLATPHVAASTDFSIRGIVDVVAENIRRLARGQKPLYENRA
jgi:phosphoglycerate dehydrogenase-like enzyme